MRRYQKSIREVTHIKRVTYRRVRGKWTAQVEFLTVVKDLKLKKVIKSTWNPAKKISDKNPDNFIEADIDIQADVERKEWRIVRKGARRRNKMKRETTYNCVQSVVSRAKEHILPDGPHVGEVVGSKVRRKRSRKKLKPVRTFEKGRSID